MYETVLRQIQVSVKARDYVMTVDAEEEITKLRPNDLVVILTVYIL